MVSSTADISIMGAGLAGILTAMQLIKQADRPVFIRIFEQSGHFGPGLAYQGRQAAHLLNVAAARMSLDPAAPDDFLDWLQHQQCYPQVERPVLAQAFLPRRLFGQYLQARWQQAQQLAAAKGCRLELCALRVTALQPGLQHHLLHCGEQVFLSRKLLLATGNELPRHPAGLEAAVLQSPAYIHNPWSDQYLQQIKPHSRVLILGNGLTMVDTLLSLREAGLKGPVLSLSPHGYSMLPHRHPGLQLTAFSQQLPQQASLRQLLRLFNRARHQIRALGVSAEPLIDALRPHTQRYWQQFTARERALFMRRLRHLWGVARHRVPLHLHDQLQQLRLQGQLQVLAGRPVQAALLDNSDGAPAILLQYQPRGGGALQQLEVDMLVNCTGPEQDYRRLPAHPFAIAIAAGQLAAGPLGLGLAAASTGQLQDSAGQCWPGLYAMGSLLRGELWETTALQEIRQQAVRLAGELLNGELSNG